MDRGKRRRGGHSIPGPNRGNKDSKVSLRPQKVANKAANDIQITAEQILKEAQAHRVQEIKPPTDGIRDEKEMQEYKLLQRNMWENKVRRQRHHIGHWIKYIMWEESMSEFTRARSLFERALEVEYQNVSLWLKYAEMEMRHKFINHARNVWERACTLLPRVDQFWYKYAYMEEVLGNYKRAHQIFEKWMNWRPDENAWMAFVKFQERINQPEECRKIMYRYLDAYPTLEVYLKVIRFEIQHKNFESARKLFEQVVDDLGEEALQSKYFIEFARFETRAKEIQRAREIYHFGLANLPVESSQRLYEEYLGFEKQYGQKEEIDLVIVEKRRKMYCSILEKNKLNYDIWFDLIYLEMNCEDNKDKTRATFEEAILNLPPVQEKRYWRRFIYFWINYAVFEELDCQDMPRAKSVYERVLKLIPHSVFTFTKVWILFAHFLLRAHDLPGARKVMGLAIAKCPSEKIFNEYVNIELQLTEVERCRSILVKFVKTFPDNPNSWIKFAEFEAGLEEYERAEAIFENAIQIQKEMPELVWKGYIDMQISRNEYQSVRSLYSRLLERTKHVKVWVSFAQFEASLHNIEGVRKIMSEGSDYLRGKQELKEERAMLLESWRDIEKAHGDEVSVRKVQELFPKKVKKQRPIKVKVGDIEEDAGLEEYFDYIFPDDDAEKKKVTVLQKAAEWKRKMLEKQMAINPAPPPPPVPPPPRFPEYRYDPMMRSIEALGLDMVDDVNEIPLDEDFEDLKND